MRRPAVEDPSPADDSREPWARQAIRSFLELFALAGLAVTQPVLDVFGRAPELFVFRGADRGDIILFAVLVAVVPALVLWSVVQVVGLAGPRPRRVAQLAATGLLLLLLVLVSLKQAEVTTGGLLLVVGLAVAAAGVLAYWRWPGVGLWLRYLAVAPLAFVALFLTTSPSADLLDSQDIASADIGPLDGPTTIVFLQFDEWPLQTIIDREGQIDAELYPHLADLAGDGVWYRNTTAAANYTTYAIPSILTGRLPEGERSPVASEHPENLFTLLAGQFDLEVTETVTRLCPTNLCDGEFIDQPDASAEDVPPDADEEPSVLRELLTDARETYRAMASPDPDATSRAQTFQNELASSAADPVDLATSEAVATANESSASGPADLGELSLQSVTDTVASIEPGEGSTLHFLHVLLPHTPYLFFPDGSRYTGGPDARAEGLRDASGRNDNVAEVAFVEQRLLLQAGYTDRVIGQVMDRLRETGLYDDAVVVVTADHGIGLTPGGVTRAPANGDELPPENIADLFYVPLVIKAPGLGPAGTATDANASTIDIVPTIAGALGIEMPWPVDGIDLGSEARPGSEKHAGLVTGGLSAGPLTLSEELTFDGDEQLAEVLDRNVDAFLQADNPSHRLFAINDAAEIVGQRSEPLVSDQPTGLTAEVRGLDAYQDVRRSSGELPAYVFADLRGAGPDELIVAAVLNGRVAAVSSTWPAPYRPHHLEALLVPDLFRDGENRLELFLVGGSEGQRTLSPIDLVGT